ncbi:hypothetical protein IOK49_03175 [Fervidicoccus fontis]|uniref:CopG family transcriptional regulator n=1 Tax=Fervidicoccus fontis TaxID=683846 RepID=A0A7C2VMK7_9CREN|nr:hypothetical protein [Fervidicoccus fontis]MBE9391080.1 hypothetical protein [Fervidicoccus fontis]PMB77022.1 MAG: hypothetical protein C0177_04480 [Fervidicoccus fontis]HEW63674.1 hypothetical protein [Fervidicoccus fontis]
MRKNRKSIAADYDLAERLKEFSKNRGMNFSKYLNEILEQCVYAEKQGLYPPNLLKEKRRQYVLEKLGFVLLPSDIIEKAKDVGELEKYGESIGKTISELSNESFEIVEMLVNNMKIGFSQSDSVMLIPSYGYQEFLRIFVVGIAKGAGLRVEKKGEFYLIYRNKDEAMKSESS